MTPFLLMRLEAPLMAFGGPAVDFIGPTRRFPGQAQVTGLLGNALGYSHTDADRLESLQSRLRMAAALLRPGELLRDYQTVYLGRPHLVDTGWTTRGAIEKRAGASSRDTHIRHRWHLADALVLVALTLDPPDQHPLLADLADALDHPARPLFIGRKPCLPSAPLRLMLADAASAEDALREGARRLGASAAVPCEFDARLADPSPDDDQDDLVDRRDWRNQIHAGERSVRRRTVALGAAP